MKSPLVRLTNGIAIAGVAALLIAAATYYAGARIASTRSVPPGLYWTSSAPLAKGAFVLVCPPATEVFAVARARDYIGAGFCPGGHGYMIKQVLAAKGEAFAVTDAGIEIKGRAIPNSKPLDVDSAGRPLPRYRTATQRVPPGSLLLSGLTAQSFDARYFGPIDQTHVRAVLVPVLTW